MRKRAIVLALSIAVFGFACSAEQEPDAPAGSNVIWIVADGLRYDAAASMEAFGDLAANATVHENATATASDCVPSFASMWTGLLPSEHGAHITRGTRNGRAIYVERPLPLDQITLAESLRQLGYETVLATANLCLADDSLGIRQGFDDLLLGAGSATMLNSRIEAWLQQRTEKPFFLVIDYCDTRLDYSTPPGVPQSEPDSERDTHRIARELDSAILGGTEYPATKLALLEERYAEGVLSLDFGLRELVRSLRERGLFEEALILLTADHGESLGEHNLLRNGRGAFEELLHVPLLIKAPRQAQASRHRERVSLLQLPALVLREACPNAPAELRDQFERHSDETDVTAEQWYASPDDFGKPWSDRFDQVLRIHYRGRWKFIDSDEGSDQLYDLNADPRELEDLSARHPGVSRDMEMRIKQVFGEL